MLSCHCGFDYDADWFWETTDYEDKYFTTLKTKRSRKCCSCKSVIHVGDECAEIYRHRPPRDEPLYIEERIHGDEVPLASWWLCEPCAGLLLAIQSLGFCCNLGGESLKEQIAEYNKEAGIQTIK